MNKDLSLNTSMIPLGSCTMKLNAASAMMPVIWPEFCDIHPFVPKEQIPGYYELINEMCETLCEITGFKAISFQPNSGAQGEYAGLMVIRAYFLNKGETERNVVIIPSSAHGTNPASASLAGMKVVIVKCDEAGNVDVTDLREKAENHKENLAAFMITYPSTHGVFEESIIEMIKIIHDNDGQVCFMSTGVNTYILRLADVYLIYAEAVLGNGESTSDAGALAALNALRKRAGLDEKASITLDDVFHERRIELAYEADYWYDLVRLHYWNPQKAIDIVNNQERGTYEWDDNDDLIINSYKASVNDGDFVLPVPEAEASKNPKLLGDPEPYEFGSDS